MSLRSEFVNIPIDEYRGLRRRSRILASLEDTGVDNWSGYYWSVETLNEWDRDGDGPDYDAETVGMWL